MFMAKQWVIYNDLYMGDLEYMAILNYVLHCFHL